MIKKFKDFDKKQSVNEDICYKENSIPKLGDKVIGVYKEDGETPCYVMIVMENSNPIKLLGDWKDLDIPTFKYIENGEYKLGDKIVKTEELYIKNNKD